MDAQVMERTKFTAIDLFCGVGGLSIGFKESGFDVLVANDFDGTAATAFKVSHPDTTFIDGPIENITGREIREAAGVKQGELDVLIGGPPCQAFSVYNHQRGMHDQRSRLFREYLRLVEALMPRCVVMENVTGITSIAGGRAVNEIHRCLEELGYLVEHRILKSEEYGVPQERRRIFFIGSRGSRFPWPKPTHGPAHQEWLFPADRKLKPFVTVWDAISDLPPLCICQGVDESEYQSEPLSDYQRAMRKGSRVLLNHVAPYLAAINLKRLSYIAQGGSWRDIPHELLPAGMKRAKRSDHTKRYGRLHPHGLACTILTKCDLHWGAYIHPTQERTLTVRESARLQSFPDRIRFVGSKGDQFRQVGNAVPPLLARAVARSVASMLAREHKREAVA
jgi:DNA (cytosine-5)-methyltransferase 1